ncbi:MAG TPA: serine hydrolase domain-containing protein [Sphingomicrobium sp.]|nr:serine hydrolase domain-containing protein [Sphingomicrobium sp.]
MDLSRRAFTGGAASLALAGSWTGRAVAQVTALAPPSYASAIAAVAAYAERHRRYFNLPGLTLGLTVPGGPSLVQNFGFANAETRSPAGPETLWQIGSISKLMTAALIHQLAAEGKLALSDRVSQHLPTIPLPQGNDITVQNLLDHVAGLPADAPLFPPGGLWQGFRPGARWSYSNTGYDILGKLAEHSGGKPLARLLEERIFAPLGMSHTKGAITAEDRLRYAQGYEAAVNDIPYSRGSSLTPASWVDVTFAAGSIGSTSEDMNKLLRSIADAAQGRGGVGLSPAAARTWAQHSVATDTPALRYGNGLMHLTAGNRSYLHHTGGMVAFSSAFHIDKASGIGAFASSSLSGYAAYRPRLLTMFAVDALAAARAGRPIPAPPPIEARIDHVRDFTGSYAGPLGRFEVRPVAGLTLFADGVSAPLELAGDDVFHTTHPKYRDFALAFERKARLVVGASWGSSSFIRDGQTYAPPPSDPTVARLAGRYVSDSPWFGTAMIVERGGKLWFGTEVPLIPVDGGRYRLGADTWSPERGWFDDPIDGRPQTFYFSGEKFVRHDV